MPSRFTLFHGSEKPRGRSLRERALHKFTAYPQTPEPYGPFFMSNLPVISRTTHPSDSPDASDSCGSGGCGSGGCGTGNPIALEESRRLPKWLKRNVPLGNQFNSTTKLLEELRLETVCENAKCPNRMECYSQQTATFMILGNVCTRPCGFCAVNRGRPEELEQDEPERVAEAALRLGLRHVVITSVTRDDLADGGADHFYQCVLAVREKTGATIEVLTPDFVNNYPALKRVVEAQPEVFNHNVETVPRLYRRVRGPKSDYRWTLELLRQVKAWDPAIRTKSGLMLGLGETTEEVLEVLVDLRDAGCDFLTLGQYLKPATDRYLPVVRYVTPEEFTWLGQQAQELGFAKVASGPFVRSSYHARDMAESEI